MVLPSSAVTVKVTGVSSVIPQALPSAGQLSASPVFFTAAYSEISSFSTAFASAASSVLAGTLMVYFVPLRSLVAPEIFSVTLLRSQAVLALSGSTSKIAFAVMFSLVAGMVNVALLAFSKSFVTSISVSEPSTLTSQPFSV